ncbi:MAG: putative DNA binding domain-containing protein [Bacteroidales bacterium]|nr:putative DNA binding domain-containing protein [Bacteroidales bacterium]
MDGKFILDNLLKQDKSDRLVFLPEISKDTLAMNVTALLNGNGGDIVVGVNDDRNVLGISIVETEEVQRDLTNRIRPVAPIDVHSIECDEKNILLISVWEGAQKPYHCDGKIYQMMGGEVVVATPNDISNLLTERKKSDFNWERMPVLGAEIEDLDMDEVRNTMKEFVRSSNEIIQDEEQFLMRNGLLKDGNLTNACIALYAKYPAQFISQARIKLSVFSSDSSSDLVEARIFEGNIFKNIGAIFQFVDMAYSKGVQINGIQRKEHWNFPRIAVREGIMNAIVHRDYNSVNGFMHILLYPNRLEIVNYGLLPAMASVIIKGGEGLSILRNPDIAQQCYYRKLIEMMGTGLPRMIQDCKDHGFDTPEFEIKDQVVRVSFPNIHYLRSVNVHQENVESDMKSYFEGVIEGVIEGVSQDIKEKLTSILCVLHGMPGIRTTKISDQTNIPTKSVERYVKQLKNVGLVKYLGSSKSGGYFLSDSILRE